MKKQMNAHFANRLSSFSGTIDYPLKNDYMFRSVLQSNLYALKGLICALLHLDANLIQSIEILNPIELGKAIADKDFYLDIKILMNDNTLINLEMQIRNEYNWPERSLVYLCRLFDNLNSGDKYKAIKPAFQIGILDFTPFPDHPEFFATYKMINEKDHHKYSDKFTLHVLDLTQIHLATGEDKTYHLDRWAELFKADTWEEFKMIAADDEYMQEAGQTLFKLNTKDQIRYQCEARVENQRIWNTMQAVLEEAKSDLAASKSALAEKDSIIAEKDSTIVKLQTVISGLEAQIVKLQSGEQPQ